MQALTKDSIIALVQEFTRKISLEYQVKAVYLFGSHAYGTPDSNSDIDIAVFLEGAPDRQMKIKVFSAGTEFNLSFEVITFSEAELQSESTDVLAEINRKGIRIA